MLAITMFVERAKVLTCDKKTCYPLEATRKTDYVFHLKRAKKSPRGDV
jgi:hypothetical protein